MDIRAILQGDYSSVHAFTRATVDNAINQALEANSQAHADVLRDISASQPSAAHMLSLSVTERSLKVTNVIQVELFAVAEMAIDGRRKVHSETFFVPNGVLTLSLRQLFPLNIVAPGASIQVFGLNGLPISPAISV